MLSRWIILPMLLAAIAVMLSLLSAEAVTVVSPARVSGDSPFANCVTGGTGTVYDNAETEPYVAVNPTNASNVVGAWQQDRWSNGASLGGVAGYSFDGGTSWKEVPLPFTSCTPGGLAYQRASDLWVSFGPDGAVYATAITLGQSGSSAVVAATSSDGGKSWTNARTIIEDGGNPRRFFDDKSSVTADPAKSGVAYSVWDRIESGGGEPDSGQQRSGAPRAPAYFAKTTDGGATWSEPRAITSADAGEATGNEILVDPHSGVLYDFFDLITEPAQGRLAYSLDFVSSADAGATWSKPRTVAEMRMASVSVPGSRTSVRAGGIIPAVAIDPSSGQLYAVWMDSRFGNGQYPEVAISSSGDGGATWSAPARVNKQAGTAAFTPTVSVGKSGAVAVTYYALRARAPGATELLTDYRVTFSADRGATFDQDVRVDGPFDILTAPNSGGYFVGDYEGLAAMGDSFVAFFVQANSGNNRNRTDVWASIVSAL